MGQPRGHQLLCFFCFLFSVLLSIICVAIGSLEITIESWCIATVLLAHADIRSFRKLLEPEHSVGRWCESALMESFVATKLGWWWQNSKCIFVMPIGFLMNQLITFVKCEELQTTAFRRPWAGCCWRGHFCCKEQLTQNLITLSIQINLLID